MSTRSFSYQNPHQGEQPGQLRDPFIIRVEDRYYLTGTSAPFWEGASPGIKLWSSDDLINWSYEGLLIDRNDSDESAWYRDRFWAPEIHFDGTSFYLTFNGRNDLTRHKHSICIARSTSILGPYEILTTDAPAIMADELYYTDQKDRYIANDASLFTDDDGLHYLLYSNTGGIWGQQLELPSCRLIGERITLALPGTKPDSWDTLIEGPYVIKHQGKYYSFYSSFTRSYEIGVLIADRMEGPWTKDERNPIIMPHAEITHSGHNCAFLGPDNRYWIAYHIQLEGDERERLAFDPVWFNEEGQLVTNAPTLTKQVIDF